MASSSLRPQSNYDVYLNFRGVDTRNNITSHLYAGLRRKSMKTFIDDQEIGRGEEIWPNHLREALTDASRLPGFRFTITSREADILLDQDAIQGKIPGLSQPASIASSVRKPRHLVTQLNIPKPVSCPSLVHTEAASYGQEIDGLSQLEKLQVLGQGNGGTVFKVRHKQTLALYALKVMQCDRGTPPNPQELNILRQTNSPYIVKCHQIFTKPSGEVSILMEYMDAGSLEIYVKSRGRLSEDIICTISRQVLKGLFYMHSRNIVHRDIKPANVLINEKMEVKIADFGISKIIQQCLERCSTPVGTRAYMSPERLDTEKHGGYNGFAADIWSFGVTMMELYMGYYPFLEPGQEPDFLSLMLAICFREPPSLPECSSEKFRDFIRRCLQKDDPSKRWTASQLLSHPFLADA
ncbi:mitogen-activated protein kinase kinase 9 [Citrus sinensis]|uniref:mitogen-activated protein kinase kinase 9-like n=1 Tax=Citrus sinensis TaxID=2711 RepID=UPI0021963759|nr:mitogen-activated protein kinase kinase 9-like [Citrus sinensis]KAH9726825.1 mitogen-activated protein kinase kinase 9 [Citrus sinensis]